MKKYTVLLSVLSMFAGISLSVFASERARLLSDVVVHDDDDNTPVEEILTRNIGNIYKDGIRTNNQELICSKRNLTTVADLFGYRKKFELTTLTHLHLNGNLLSSHDLRTALDNGSVLKFLDFSNNQVTTLNNIPTHECLETLLLHNNTIFMKI